jgi:hypothetical protein
LLAVIGLRSCPHKLNTPEPHPSVERVAIRDSGTLAQPYPPAKLLLAQPYPPATLLLAQPYPPATLLLALPAATIVAAAVAAVAAAAAAAMLGVLYWQLSKNRLLLLAAGESVRAAYCSAL